MIVVLHEALEWSESHCKATKEKYPELKGFDTIVDLVVAYQEGAKYIQNELAKVKARLREKQLTQSETDCTEPNLICVQNADVFAAYDEAIKMIDEILKL
jgi:hypothetical protein